MANNCDNYITIEASAKIRRLIRKHAERGTLLEFMLPGKTNDASKRFGTSCVRDFQFHESGNGVLTFQCFSSWCPPLNALRHFSGRKGVESVEALYFESGNAFAGIANMKDGRLSDLCYDCNSSNWRELPSELKDTFMLDGFYAEEEADAEAA